MLANKLLTTALLLAGFSAGHANAQSCGPQALGVSRVIAVGGAPQLGLKTYPQTLDLKDHEVVLTFDDGPSATTPRVLEALKAECARATFFLIGRNAAENPALVKREIADSHTVGHHSFSHPARTLRSLPLTAALADIDRGVAAVDRAADGKESQFFRFPGFGDTPALLVALAQKKMPVFGADLWASDWNDMTSEEELELVMGRLRRSGGGILLLHDTRRQTADMIPALLAALKAEKFHLVHIVAGEAPPPLRPAPSGWTSETDATLQQMGIDAPLRTKSPGPPPDGVPAQEQTDGTAPAMPEPLAPATKP
jgi:peptidoglycan/xylan/chitin deacetylase (PgdA/CDA1 family)